MFNIANSSISRVFRLNHTDLCGSYDNYEADDSKVEILLVKVVVKYINYFYFKVSGVIFLFHAYCSDLVSFKFLIIFAFG